MLAAGALFVVPGVLAQSSDGLKPVPQGNPYQPGPSSRPKCDGASQKARRECGWWAFDEEKPPEEELIPPPPPPAPNKPVDPVTVAEEIDCKDPAQWTPPCGFIDPAGNFDFQAKQRDALLKRMVVSTNDPKAVKDFQKYNRWVFDQGGQIARLWEFNQAQDPSLDRTAMDPISSMGLRLMSQVSDKRDADFFTMLKEDGAFIVFFSRSDCNFCHQMIPVVTQLSKSIGLKVYNASLDDKCLPGLEDGCMTGDQVLAPARALQVRVVPDIMVFNPKDSSWVRVASGFATADRIKSRMRTFGTAIKVAMENGVKNGEGFTPSVDFKGKLNAIATSGAIELPPSITMETPK